MRIMGMAAALLVCGAAGAQASEEVDAATVAKIEAMLAQMQCQMDPDDIERDGTGYELDDVFCADGQYDIDLDAELQVVGKKKE